MLKDMIVSMPTIMPSNYGFSQFDKSGNLISISTIEFRVITYSGIVLDPVVYGPTGTWAQTTANGAGTRSASSQASIKPGLK